MEKAQRRRIGKKASLFYLSLLTSLFAMWSTATCDAFADESIGIFPPSNNAGDWLVKSVCVDQSNHPIAFDPFYTCPADSRVRKILPGEPLPFHNLNQTGNLRSDSFPLIDTKGKPLPFRTFDWGPPFGEFMNNTDGYDVYVTKNGWISIANTKAADAGSVTFFGKNCTVGNGWLLFPSKDFLRGGRTYAPIMGVYWEQQGQSFPGSCPRLYVDSETQWRLESKANFGGVGKNKQKEMDSLIVYHGFENTPNFIEHGHMEVFYFTQQYGLTKWEFWTPADQGKKAAASRCVLPDQVTYENAQFIISDCQDFSNITLDATADIPQWPIPQANILKHAHFDTLDGWHSSLIRETEGQFETLRNSTSIIDAKFAPEGIRFLEISCEASKEDCGSVYQDIPAKSIPNGRYLYGVEGLSMSGEGKLRVALQQLDSNNAIVWSDFFEETVSQYNGSHPSIMQEHTSVLQSAKFIHATSTVAIDARAAKFRMIITPRTPGKFGLVSAWLNRWPPAH